MVETILPWIRATHLSAVLSGLGLTLFQLVVIPRALGARALPAITQARLDRIVHWLLALAIASGLCWLVAQAAYIGDAVSVGAAADAIWPFASGTRFGRIMLVRLGLLLLALALVCGQQRRDRIGAAAMLVALTLHAFTGHAAAQGGPAGYWTTSLVAIHLLAAAGWVGGIVALLVTARAVPVRDLSHLLGAFSAYGLVLVGAIALTAIGQGLALIGGLPGLLGTAYGHIAIAKIALMVAMLAIASANRWIWLPRLVDRTKSVDATRSALLASIGAELALGVCVLVLAAYLASTPPGIHTQPVWPLPWRPSSELLWDPDLGPGIQRMVALVVMGLCLAAFGLARRRWRAPALGLGAVLIVVAAPELSILKSEAYPTSFWVSPSGFSAASVMAGAELFAANCARCHGPTGHGDGPDARSLAIPPADLTADHLWAHTDGDLFWWISDGMEGPDGAKAMPGFAAEFSEEERWALVDFVHANNAGEWSKAGRGPLVAAVPAPDADFSCASDTPRRLSGFHGAPLVVALRAPDFRLDSDRVRVLEVRGKANQGRCIAPDDDAAGAYALMAGSTSGLALVDSAGWLRAVMTVATPPAEVLAALRDFEARPLTAVAAHHH